MKIKCKFWFNTRYVNSTIEEEIEIDVDDKATEQEIDEEIEEVWAEWRNNQCEGGWDKLTEPKLK